LGSSTWKWLGLATQDLHTDGEIVRSDLEDMFTDIERQRDARTHMKEDLEAKAERKFREDLHTTYRVFDDFLSPSEELDLILKRTHDFLISDLDEGNAVQWKPSVSGEKVGRNAQIAERAVKLKTIMRTLRIYEDGTAMHQSLRQYLQHGTPRNRLVKKIAAVRKTAEQIKNDVNQFEGWEHHRKDIVLVQYFILDQVGQIM